MKKENLQKFKEGVKVLMNERMNYRIDKGEFDSIFRTFLDGDSLTFTMELEFRPNDIMFMNSLIGNGVTDEVRQKVRALWDKAA